MASDSLIAALRFAWPMLGRDSPSFSILMQFDPPQSAPGSMLYACAMGRQIEIARCDQQIENLERRIAALRSEPGASSGLLGAELIELLERSLKDLKWRRSLLMGSN